MFKRKITESQKEMVACEQFYKCKNEPGSKLEEQLKYKCPLWAKSNLGVQGIFDKAGYEIEHTVCGDDSDSNLQALCTSCHSVKTKYFMITKAEQPAEVHPSSGIFLEFMKIGLVCTKSNRDFEQISILYSSLKNWYTESYNGKCPYTKNQFTEYLVNGGYKVVKGCLYQYKYLIDCQTDGNLSDDECN